MEKYEIIAGLIIGFIFLVMLLVVALLIGAKKQLGKYDIENNKSVKHNYPNK